MLDGWVKEFRRYVKPFGCNSGSWQTDTFRQQIPHLCITSRR